MKNTPLLRLLFRPSKRLTHYLIALHVLAGIACLINSLNLPLKASLFAWVLGHFYYSIQHQPHDDALEYVEGSWQLIKHSERLTIDILPSTVVSAMAIFLHFRYDNQFKTLLVLPDALTSDEYRQLIVALKTTLATQRGLDYQV